MRAAELSRRNLFAGSAGAAAFAACPALARTVAAASNLKPWAIVQAMLDGYVAAGKIPGGVGAIGRGTDPAVFLGAGTLGRDSLDPAGADSLFRIYSMTKPITGMATMILIEEGKVGLDQDIADFIPGFRNPRVLVDPMKDLTSRPAVRPVTIRNLLTHTAGLGYTIVTKGPLLDEYLRLGISPAQISRKSLPGLPRVQIAPSLAEFADRLATLPLIADPGTKWSYSVALDLMGRVIEIASGMAFDAYLKSRIFDPLGMKSTFFQVPPSETARLTTNYGVSILGKFALDSAKDSIFADRPPFPFGGAGLVSSPRDYDRFLQMLAGYGAVGDVRIMKDATARLGMSNLLPPGTDTSSKLIDGQGFGAGGRVLIARSDRSPAGIGTYGWGGAAATIAWVDPVNRIRAGGYAQFMPDTAMPFTGGFARAVYASL